MHGMIYKMHYIEKQIENTDNQKKKHIIMLIMVSEVIGLSEDILAE